MADVAAYRTLLGSRLRSQLQYRASFWLDVLNSVAISALELTVVYVVLSRVDSLGGLTSGQVVLVFAVAQTAFAVADLLFGHLDRMPVHVRTGTLDAMLLRPLPLFGQLLCGEISLRRVGRAVAGAGVLVVAVQLSDADWTAPRVLALLGTLVTATVVFGSLFALAGAVQFWLLDGAEVSNAFTYGGGYAASYPSTVYAPAVRWLFVVLVPAGFVSYLPVVAILGLPAPPGLPGWLGWCTPVVAAALVGLTAVAWRRGVRHYEGTGS